ncbi:MAG: hypothetical protein EBX36_04015 [Planctomycetia bacterium]|nr:hypothetical protein [Planctomycetia bacterium]
MTEDFRTRFDPTRRPGDPGAGAAPVEAEEADGLTGPPTEAYSLVSADRRQKMMVVFRFKTGNAVALAYGYLVSVEYDPSLAIQMDFSGY